MKAYAHGETPLVVIVGETASGKSLLAHTLATKHDGEVISADSWSVYKGFDIGTAKPSPKQQTEVRYHMINIAEAEDGFNAALFKLQANKSISDILSRGKVPIMVGGSGLYIDSVLFDFSFSPRASSERRKELQDMSIEKLTKVISDMKIDTTDIDMRNKRRLVRLIESEGVRPNHKPLRNNTIIVGLRTNRQVLRREIEKRVNVMFKNGLKREVESLRSKYSWDIEPMKGIGYREFRQYFNNSQSLSATKRQIVKSTIDLAKRQRTWFKRNPHIVWFDERGSAEKYLESILQVAAWNLPSTDR